MPVVLLCHFDGTNGQTTFTDSSLNNTLTRIDTSTVVTTTSPKFGTGSGDFSGGVNAGIDTNNSSNFNLGSGQFTVEAWGYFTSAPGSGTSIVFGNFLGSSNLGWDFGIVGGALAFYYSTTGTNNLNVGAAYTPALNTWIHFAADRDASNVLRVYANGVVVASATVTATIFNSTTTLRIGNDANGGRNFLGHLDEARVTTGLAQYGGAFTPPTAPFSVEADLSKLVSYAVLDKTGPQASKIISYAVLQTVALPLPVPKRLFPAEESESEPWFPRHLGTAFPPQPENLSKLVSYAVLDTAGPLLSKLVSYAVLNETGPLLSKLVSYAVLQTPVPALPWTRAIRFKDEEIEIEWYPTLRRQARSVPAVIGIGRLRPYFAVSST